jgi:glycosidase
MTPTRYDTVLRIGATECADARFMEFHVNARVRRECDFDESLFASSGNVVFANLKAARVFVERYNKRVDGKKHPERYLKAGQLNAMGLIDEIFHYVARLYRERVLSTLIEGAEAAIVQSIGKKRLDEILLAFATEFPAMAVYRGKTDPEAWLSGTGDHGIANRLIALEELALLRLANENPAFEPFFPIFSESALKKLDGYDEAWDAFRTYSALNPPFGPEGLDLVSMLKAPINFSPYDLKGQLEYIRTRWANLLGEWLSRLLAGIDTIAEEEKAGWSGGGGVAGYPDMSAYEFGDISKEYERFSPDREWMPNVVLMAKSALVWLDQLSKKYGREIRRLDQIPDEELDSLAAAGFTGLWLIGLWERSKASARIKQICGNPEAAASAYSLDDYEIADELGGWGALDNLRVRAWRRGIRMASDMVPNHTGMDAKWVVEKPDLFVQTRECPFPGYDFGGENLSHDGRVGVYLENHYYSKSDCAVVFKRVDNATGDARYIYHGNDGTGMPWNDTAQIDFLNPEAREEVIQKILHVAGNFPIIRFDAAMVLAKKHIQRLWYPEPGKGGDIASRSEHSLTRDEFERRIPEEFWREVVDRCAREIPDTLLLAEAFWMMEGYFVRTLGMHRVYNSAFMNMLKREDNAKYRTTIKNTLEFDPEILKRYVNFMNNPDEETAVAQFGSGDKYFGVCTMMVAMPGLPMFGHGQIEGFEEKYGMEYRRAYRDETPNEGLVERHRREIFPLMKKRWLFAGVENFYLYDFFENGHVNENVFAWSNRAGGERALILYNNVYGQANGWVKDSVAYAVKNPDGSKGLAQKGLAEALALDVRPDRYCVMQEQRTSLWYIRTTEEIEANGLYAHLDGFQTQAFGNVYEVDDDAAKTWKTLYASLAGRGIRDVHMGLQNIRYRDLYVALSALASPEYFMTFRDRAIAHHDAEKQGPNRVSPNVAFVASLEPGARAFFKEVLALIGKNTQGAREDAIAKRKAVTKGVDSRTKPAQGEAADRAWEYLSRSLSRLLSLGERKIAKKEGRARKSAGEILLDNFAIEYVDDPSKAIAVAAALILHSVRFLLPKGDPAAARAAIDSWSLARKLADLVEDYGIKASGFGERLETFADALVLADLGGTTAKRTAALVSGIFADGRVSSRARVHEWDGVEWFGKEQAESLVDDCLLLKTLGAGPKDSLADLAGIRTLAFGAFSASEYRVSSIREAFSGEKTVGKKAGSPDGSRVKKRFLLGALAVIGKKAIGKKRKCKRATLNRRAKASTRTRPRKEGR